MSKYVKYRCHFWNQRVLKRREMLNSVISYASKKNMLKHELPGSGDDEAEEKVICFEAQSFRRKKTEQTRECFRDNLMERYSGVF